MEKKCIYYFFEYLKYYKKILFNLDFGLSANIINKKKLNFKTTDLINIIIYSD